MLKESNNIKIFIFLSVENLDLLISRIGIQPCQSPECIFGGRKTESKGREGKLMFIEHLLHLR